MTVRRPVDRLRGLGHRTLHRASNRWYDLRAVLAGYCNDCPWRPEPDAGGAYADWRCALRRRHDGPHRYRNYVWTENGRTDYQPIPLMPSQPWRRTCTPSLRQARGRRRWLEARSAQARIRAEASDG